MPSTNFHRGEHGFAFVNRFPGLPSPTNTIEAFAVKEEPDEARTIHGLCGGMCFASLDYFFDGRPSPDFTKAPAPGSSMYRYLYGRQQASLGFLYRHVLRYAHNMIISKRGAQNLSYDQWRTLKRNLEEEKPSVLGLIFSAARKSMLLWHNHQVLAYGYEEVAPGQYRVDLYDPNYLEDRDVWLDIKQFELSPGLLGIEATLSTDGKKPKAIHSFFIVPYSVKEPPRALKASPD